MATRTDGAGGRRRRAAGWQLWLDRRNGLYSVRFTHQGRRYKIATSEADRGRATERGARLYADAVAGRIRPGAKPVARPGGPVYELAADWLAAVEPELDPTTWRQYKTYVKAHWQPFFQTVDQLTTAAIGYYIRERLRRVLRRTVLKELSALRGMLRWATEQGCMLAVVVPTPGAKVTGVRATGRGAHKAAAVELTDAEVAAFLAALPERTPRGFVVRARFVVAWETGLRPQTLAELLAPSDYRRGAATLRIRDEADKVRYGREVPLTAAARAALDSVCPAAGLIFGAHDLRDHVRAAAVKAGLAPAKAAHLSQYDLRHARVTYWCEHSNNLPGVAYLVGHRHLTTTNRYVHPNARAAAAVLAAGDGTPSGLAAPAAPAPEAPAAAAASDGCGRGGSNSHSLSTTGT